MRRSRSTLCTAALTGAVLAAGALAGCGDGAEPTARPGPPPAAAATGEPSGDADPTATADGRPAGPKDPCGLLSVEEAAAAAGNPVTGAKPLGVVCVWEPQDLDDATNVQVGVAFVPVGPGVDPADMCTAGLPGIPGAKPFAGVGDRAWWDFKQSPLGNSGNLHVCAGKGMVDTSAIGKRSESELRDIAVSLAETVLPRL